MIVISTKKFSVLVDIKRKLSKYQFYTFPHQTKMYIMCHSNCSLFNPRDSSVMWTGWGIRGICNEEIRKYLFGPLRKSSPPPIQRKKPKFANFRLRSALWCLSAVIWPQWWASGESFRFSHKIFSGIFWGVDQNTINFKIPNFSRGRDVMWWMRGSVDRGQFEWHISCFQSVT